jgi:hypothetical protein
MRNNVNTLEVIMVELLDELEQLQASTHYHSDLPPTPANYAKQWQTASRFTTEIGFCVERLVEELARRGLMRADAQSWDRPAIEGIGSIDNGGDDEVPL